MTFDQAKLAFLNESKELLTEMEQGLLELEKLPDDKDIVNAIFRAAHTIKGTGGIFGFDHVESFTHVVENVLERVRSGTLMVAEELIATLLSCRDHIGILVEAAVAEQDIGAAAQQRGESLLGALERVVGCALRKSGEATVEVVGTGPMPPSADQEWNIRIGFGRNVLRDGMDPFAFIRYLSRLGTLASVTTNHDELPAVADMDPESCYLRIDVELISSSVDKAAIEKVFDFVKDDCQLSIHPPVAKMWEFISTINKLPDEARRIGEILNDAGVLTQRELVQALAKQSEIKNKTGAEAPPLGDVLVQEGIVDRPVIDAALEKQQKAKAANVSGGRQLKVDADKLDQLINLVGELVIAGASSKLLAQHYGEDSLLESMSVMSRLVEEIRDNALRLRMVQIGETFQRFSRVVRDVSREIDKNIQLQISGGEAELDKTMVEKIGDPLMHLVRNAMDHGIEAEDERVASGKAAKGTVSLNAYHDSGSIVIQVSDDGRGLSRPKIEAKAMEKGLIEAGQVLTDQEMYRLIFEPGFSTAERVTNLSGRGVGMDVVKKNIESLRGSVDIESAAGKGTTVSIRLPLTLAIIDGFLVRVGRGSYVLPLDTVIECIELTDEDKKSSRNNNYINLRGEVLPFLRLREMFDEAGEQTGRESIVVVQYGGQAAGLVVDELLGEFQTVIKPLGKIFERLKGVSGATILGSGQVAVILDVAGLINRAANSGPRDFAYRDVPATAPRSPTLH